MDHGTGPPVTWVKLDDAMPHHPKVMAAGPQAFALDVAAIAYSNRYLTDGFIGDEQLPAVLPCLSQPKRHATKLADVGRWQRDDERGGWHIHDVHEYQPTAKEQREVSKKRAEAGKRGGSKSGASRRANAKQVASLGVEANANPGPVPVPLATDVARKPSSSADADRDEIDRQFDDEFWPIYPPRNGKKLGRRAALVEWRRLSDAERDRAVVGARHLAASEQMPKDAERFLRRGKGGERPFDDWQEPAARDGPKQLHNVSEITTGGRF